MSETPVLMATDLSAESAASYPMARALAGALSSELELVHVVHDPAMMVANPQVSPPSAIADPKEKGEVERSLSSWAERFDPPPASTVVVGGASSADALVDHAEERGALMIALASHGRSGIERLLAGSFTEQVLRATSIPLVVVPMAREGAEAGDADASDEGEPALVHRHLLVAIDDSEDSNAVLGPAALLARELESRVTLLHVTGDLLAVPVGELAVPPASPTEYTRHLDAANERLEEARARFGDLPVDTELLVGDAVPAITTFADEHPFDLVCMASHGRRGIRRLLIGSTTEGVLRHVTRPVVVFPIP